MTLFTEFEVRSRFEVRGSRFEVRVVHVTIKRILSQLCLSNSIDTGVFDHSVPEVVGVRLTPIVQI